MSTVPAIPAYNPLGLPAGSVRAIITIQIVGLFSVQLLMPEDRPVEIPLFMFGLLPMVLLFFAAHGRSIRPHGSHVWSPLFLPRGTLRILIVAAFVASLAYAYHLNPELLRGRLTPKESQLWQWQPLMLTLGLGFLVGHVIGLGAWRNTPAFQNMIAWVSLIAMLMLLAEVAIELVIKPGLFEQWEPFTWECVLSGVVAFYFGVRS